MVQWLRLHTPTAGDAGSIPDQGAKIPHAMQRGQKKKKIKIELAYDPAIPPLGIYPKEVKIGS